MSVILNASRIKHRNDAKSAKPKKKKRHVQVKKVVVVPCSKVWRFVIAETSVQVTFRVDTMEVWCNDQKVDTEDEFFEGGANYYFKLFDEEASIEGRITNGRMDYSLTVGGYMLEEVKDDEPARPQQAANGHAHGAYAAADEEPHYDMAANGVNDVTLQEKKNV